MDSENATQAARSITDRFEARFNRARELGCTMLLSVVEGRSVLDALRATEASLRTGWRDIASAIQWEPCVVTDGTHAALSALSQADDGSWYWAIDPEDGLWFEPTHWAYPPSTVPISQDGEEHLCVDCVGVLDDDGYCQACEGARDSLTVFQAYERGKRDGAR